MVNLPFVPLGDFADLIRQKHEVLQLSLSSEAPTHLNSDRREKLRQDEWLISTILREINQLKGISEAERKIRRSLQKWVTPFRVNRKEVSDLAHAEEAAPAAEKLKKTLPY
ncbi:MAG: hypothetical protein ABSF85_18555 [Terriglobales bacterium]